MNSNLLSVAMSLLATIALAADSDFKPASTNASVAGKWKSEFDTRVGHLNYVYEFKVDGDKLTGTAIREREGAKTETELKDGRLNGDQVSFVEPIKVQDQDVRIEYSGKLSGDQIKFTRKVGDFATTEIVATRVKEASASLDGKWNTEFDSQIGQQKYTYELKADGQKLTGKAFGDTQFGKTETPITEGKVGPDGVSFVEMLKVQDREIRVEYAGKLVGDELKLTRKVGDIATEEIVAKRAKASPQK
jgi:hypothetical protein